MRVLSPTSGSPAWGSGLGRRRPQSIWLWRPVGLDHRSFTGLGETETPFLEDTHKVSCAPEPRAKAVTLWLWLSLGTYKLVANISGSAHLKEDTLHGTLAPRPGPTQQPIGSSAGIPQGKQPTGREHSPTQQQAACLMTPWAHSHL